MTDKGKRGTSEFEGNDGNILYLHCKGGCVTMCVCVCVIYMNLNVYKLHLSTIYKYIYVYELKCI